MATTTTHSADHFSRREGRKHALAKAMKSPLHPTIETFVPETRKSIWDGFLQVCKPPIRKDVRVLLKEKAALETQNAALIKALADLENKTPVAVATTE